jgi:hypothetical protein
VKKNIPPSILGRRYRDIPDYGTAARGAKVAAEVYSRELRKSLAELASGITTAEALVRG